MTESGNGGGWLERWWRAKDDDEQVGFIVGAAVVALTGFAMLIGILQSPSLSRTWKLIIGLGSAAVGFVAFVAIVAILRRRFEAVERWLYALGWLVAASLVPLAVTVFDRDAQGWGLAVLAGWLLALLPGFLYLQFRTVRGKTLLEEYLTHLDRLDVDVYGTVPDATDVRTPPAGADDASFDEYDEALRNLYVRKFHGVFGQGVASGQPGEPPGDDRHGARTKLRGDTLWPVLWLTVLVAIGWTAVLAPNTVFDLRPFGQDFALPNPSGAEKALRFGFLGAYFYVIQMLVRRYFQKDLKPDAYISAVLRMVTVPLIVVVVHTAQFGDAATASNVQLAVAFVIGVFPEVGLEAIRELVSRALGRIVPSLRAEYPLSQIDGLNLFYQSRLLEEGIEDMQNLATADFVDLLLQTRIPVGRMVDWMDQAHLLIRLPAPERTKAGGVKDSKERNELRKYGVRCATDLELAVNGAKPAPDELRAALPGVDFVLRTLRQEPNMDHVRAWKKRNGKGHAAGRLLGVA